MQTSKQWIEYFATNLKQKRIDWTIQPTMTKQEKENILPSLQAWQLGETSEGKHLIAAATKYAIANGDIYYCEAVALFIKEEQKHGNNLGRYLDLISEKRIQHNWGDTLFRKIRYFNTSMELWTIAVITVESTAQIFYQSMKTASNCTLLKQICTDILIDEAFHIDFQMQRMAIIFSNKAKWSKFISFYLYKFFYFSVILLVWLTHKKVFIAGGITFKKYMKIMRLKCKKTIQQLKPYINNKQVKIENKNIETRTPKKEFIF